MLDLARWVCIRWNLFPRLACGDKKYGTVANIVGLERDGICAYLPTADLTERTSFYSLKDFSYDPDRDLFICPHGQELPFRKHNYGMEYFVYQAAPGVCDACTVRAKCTASKAGRQIHRSFFQDYLDRVAVYRQTEAYNKALRKRQVWVEPLFGEAKQWHEGRRFRLRGLENVNIEGLFRATGQNIKRLLKGRTWRSPLKPADSAALRPTFDGILAGPDQAADFFNRLFQHAGLLCPLAIISSLKLILFDYP